MGSIFCAWFWMRSKNIEISDPGSPQDPGYSHRYQQAETPSIFGGYFIEGG